MKRVVVHIDRLVLRGFGRDDREGIAEGLRAELEQLLVTQSAAERMVGLDGIARLKIAPVHVGQGTKPASVGAQTARSIARGLKS
jgi:hypothetical protein